MNPKIPSKELEKKSKKWLKDEPKGSSLNSPWPVATETLKDPWRDVTDLLGKIEPLVQVPEKYDFQKLHDQVMQRVDQLTPPWMKKRS